MMTLGRVIAWPLIVGGIVLAVAWSAWRIASGKAPIDAISTAASGFAAYAVAALALALFIDWVAARMTRFTTRYPRFLSLDWLVPLAGVIGFGVGCAVWK